MLYIFRGEITSRIMMILLWTILIGFFVGIIARLLMPGTGNAGFIITVLLGIGGSFFASWLGRQIGFYQSGETAGFIGSVIGAVLILAIYRFIKK